MRILYLGLPLGALHLVASGFSPVAFVIGHPGAPGMRRLRRRLGPRGALLLGRPDLDDGEVQRLISSARPDVLLSFFWPRKIPAAVLEQVPRGAFGTHPSLLPRWRGPDPYFWALRHGDEETGVSLHRLTEEYDEGAVVARRRLRVSPDDDAWRLARRLDRPALELLAEAARRLDAGEALSGEPQDEASATFAPAPSEQQYAIDWSATAESILRLVRASAPLPGATAMLGDVVLEVVRAIACHERPPGGLRAAEAWRTASGAVAVRCGDLQDVVLVEVREPGGETTDPAERLGLAQRG